MNAHLGDKVRRHRGRHKQERHDQQLVQRRLTQRERVDHGCQQQHANANGADLGRGVQAGHGVVEFQQTDHTNNHKT